MGKARKLFFSSYDLFHPSIQYREIALLLELTTGDHIHPYIPKLHGIGIFGGSVNIAIQYMDGGSLDIFREAGLPLSEEEIKYLLLVVSYTIQSLAVDYLFLHRDIKPANLLINSRGEIYINDFNLCIKLKSHDERHRFLYGPGPGTPGFKAPEVRDLDGRQYSYWADMYSLGRTAIKLGGFSPMEVEYGVVTGEMMGGQLDGWSQEGMKVLEGFVDDDPLTRWDFTDLIASKWAQSYGGGEVLYTAEELKTAVATKTLAPPASLVDKVHAVKGFKECLRMYQEERWQKKEMKKMMMIKKADAVAVAEEKQKEEVVKEKKDDGAAAEAMIAAPVGA